MLGASPKCKGRVGSVSAYVIKLTSAPPKQKMVACRFFVHGHCKFGDQCRYQHDSVVTQATVVRATMSAKKVPSVKAAEQLVQEQSASASSSQAYCEDKIDAHLGRAENVLKSSGAKVYGPKKRLAQSSSSSQRLGTTILPWKK